MEAGVIDRYAHKIGGKRGVAEIDSWTRGRENEVAVEFNHKDVGMGNGWKVL